jgi:hypothetical protein
MVQKIDCVLSVSLAICNLFQIEIRAPARDFFVYHLIQGLKPLAIFNSAPLELLFEDKFYHLGIKEIEKIRGES